jgi:MFS family permease
VIRPISFVVDRVAPPRLGRGFRWLFSSTLISNVGDGIALAAGPLLIASQTHDPLLVSTAVLAQVLPPLLFGAIAGAISDRYDRRRIVVAVNLARAAVLAALAVTIASGTVNIAIVLGSLFVLGTAETFADIGSSSLLPRVVPREDLGLANARLQGAYILTNDLLAPPIGAFLFVLGMATPFAANAACFALGAVLVARVATSAAEEAGQPSPGALRVDLVEGLRWLLGHAPMRTLALTIVAFNVTFGAAWGVLVLYARQQLGMDEIGFGLMTSAMAIGGLIATASYGALERRFSLATIMRTGLLIETATHLVLALTHEPLVALLTLGLFGAHASVWGTTATTIRQRAVPDSLLGRVTGVYTVGVYAGIAVGTPIGGLLAREFGIAAPFWFGFVGSALLVTLLWREFSHIAHAGAAGPATGAGTATT